METLIGVLLGVVVGTVFTALVLRRTGRSAAIEQPAAAAEPAPSTPEPERLVPPTPKPAPARVLSAQSWPDLVEQIGVRLRERQLPLEQVDRLVQAARILAGNDVDLLRELARLSARCGHPEGGLACLDTVPELSRTPRDDLEAAVLHLDAGHHIAALILLDGLGDMEELPSPARVKGLVARCAARLESPTPSRHLIKDARRDLYAATVTGAIPDEWFPPAVEAWMELVDGNPTLALEEIEALPDSVREQPRWSRLHGDALAQLGRQNEAMAAWMYARDHSHPESWIYRTLSRRIGDWGDYDTQDALPSIADDESESDADLV